MVSKLVISIAMLIAGCLALSGCGMYIGPKDSPYLKLPDGFAFNVGVNNIDHVIDRKGLNVEKKAERY